MTVDKFGRFGKKEEEHGVLPHTADGGYDMENKRLHNVKLPISVNDAATKGYVLEQSVKKTVEGDYDFNHKLIRNIKDPVHLTDGVTLSFVKKYSLHKSTNNDNYDANKKLIRNLATPLLSNDAATMEYVNKKSLSKSTEGHYLLGNKLLRDVQDPILPTDAATKNFVESKTIKRTGQENHYDMQNKRIKNVESPVDDSDVATKKYITEVIPTKHDDHWSFSNKRLSDVQAPIYEGEAVNLTTLHLLTVCRKRKDDKTFDSKNLRISNLGLCEEDNDAVNKRFVTELVKSWTTENEKHLHRLGRALFKYIHRSSGRAAEPNVDSHNYLDWNEIHHGVEKEQNENIRGETLSSYLKKELSDIVEKEEEGETNK